MRGPPPKLSNPSMFTLTDLTEVLHIDKHIRDYVLFPIFLVMFLQGLLRHFISQALKSTPKPLDEEAQVRASIVARSALLRQNGHMLSPESFEKRRQWFLDVGLVVPEPIEEKIPTDPLAAIDPEDMAGMTGMLSSQVGAMLPNMLTMGWVSYFFSGFVLIKLPFPIPDAFKPMLQRGIYLEDLDSSYVSSLSWYFLSLFGLRGVFAMILGKNNATDDSKLMQQQLSVTPQIGGKKDPWMAVKKERNELMIHKHTYTLPMLEPAAKAAK